MTNKIVVTRHQGLVEYLKEIGLVDEGIEIISHVNDPSQIRGKVVIGILPLFLAALTEKVIDIPLDIPPELRGKELSLEQVRQYAGKPTTYKIEKLRSNTEIEEFISQMEGSISEKEDQLKVAKERDNIFRTFELEQEIEALRSDIRKARREAV